MATPVQKLPTGVATAVRNDERKDDGVKPKPPTVRKAEEFSKEFLDYLAKSPKSGDLGDRCEECHCCCWWWWK